MPGLRMSDVVLFHWTGCSCRQKRLELFDLAAPIRQARSATCTSLRGQAPSSPISATSSRRIRHLRTPQTRSFDTCIRTRPRKSRLIRIKQANTPLFPRILSILTDRFRSTSKQNLIPHNLHHFNRTFFLAFSFPQHGHRLAEFLDLASHALMSANIEIHPFHPSTAIWIRNTFCIVRKYQATDFCRCVDI